MFFLKQAFEENVELGDVAGFFFAVPRFPFHKAVFAACDGSRLGCKLVAHHANAVVNEKARDLLHVVLYLQVSFARTGFFAAWRLEFKKDNGDAVDKQNHVGTLVRFFDDCPLIRDDETVVACVFKIDQVNNFGLVFSFVGIRYLHTVLQIIREEEILFYKVVVFKMAQLVERFG